MHGVFGGEMAETEPRILAKGLSMTNLNILKEVVEKEIDSRRSEQPVMATEPVNQCNMVDPEHKTYKGPTLRDSRDESTLSYAREASYPRGPREMADDKMASEFAQRVVESADDMAFVKMVCKHDVKLFRLKQRIEGLHNGLQHVDGEIRRVAQMVHNVEAGLAQLSMNPRSEKESIRSLFALFEKLSDDIERVREQNRSLSQDVGVTQMGMLPHRVKTLEGRIASFERKLSKADKIENKRKSPGR